MILSESKRDDMLLPYIELLKSKGIETNLREFKGYMLKKLTNEGRMRNLSLSSNYYLAGAIRYYFNGDLTLNNDLDIFNNGETNNDIWNEDVCAKLNVLVNILRNAYIDTIGEKFEQPEDFGNLPLNKLLRKYGKKIKTEMEKGSSIIGMESEPVDDGINRDPRVGNGYTFDIIYSYDDATKYNSYTEPGAWCITYGQQHYDGYIRRRNIHYVILRKNGFEDVARKKGEGWTRQKPQDEYGCSLIALLQKNDTGEPDYITSRWNHGYGDDTRCEADHAFTKEEFMAKTGITDEDLQRIFTIWNADKSKYSNNDSRETSVTSTEKLNAMRQLKYAQMRMNGGDLNMNNTFRVIYNLNGSITDYIDGRVKLNKGVFWCVSTFESEHEFYFLMDRGKIIFDTIVPSNIYDSVRSTNINENNNAKLDGYQNLVAIITNKFLMLYDLRTHSLISIDGVFKFKNIPSIGGNLEGINSSTVFYDLRLGKEQLAIMSLSTNKPLRLPNGSYWFNIVRGSGTHNYWNDGIGRSNLQVRYHGGAKGSILEMIYDRSSGERYFYNVDERRYLSDDEIPQVNNGILKLHSGYNMPNTITFKLDRNGSLENEAWNAPLVIVKDGKFINIDGNTEFKYVQYLGDGLLNYTTEMEGYRFVNFKIYDFNTNSHVVLPNGRLNIHTVEDSSDSNSPINSRLLFIKYKDTLDNKSLFIYDKKQKSFLKNPVGYPSKDTFVVERNGFKDGSGVIIALVPSPRPWWTYYQTRDQDDSWKEDYGTLYIPGANTTDVYKDDSVSYNSRFTNIKIVGGPDRRDNVENNDNFSDVEMQQMVREVVDRILNQK